MAAAAVVAAPLSRQWLHAPSGTPTPCTTHTGLGDHLQAVQVGEGGQGVGRSHSYRAVVSTGASCIFCWLLLLLSAGASQAGRGRGAAREFILRREDT